MRARGGPSHAAQSPRPGPLPLVSSDPSETRSELGKGEGAGGEGNGGSLIPRPGSWDGRAHPLHSAQSPTLLALKPRALGHVAASPWASVSRLVPRRGPGGLSLIDPHGDETALL